jgi:hypothetical protein
MTVPMGMDPMTMFGGMALQGFMGARQEQAQAMANKIKWEEQQFQARWQNQIQNRQIAKANAIQWMNNKKIEQAANKERAEGEFWLRYNYNNETGQMSRNLQQANDSLLDNIYSRGLDPKSGTGRALFQMSLERAQDVFKSQNLTYENAMVSTERQQQQRLAQRNFNYNSHIPFMGGTYTGPDPSSVFQSSMMSGLAQAGFGAYETGAQNTYNQALLDSIG